MKPLAEKQRRFVENYLGRARGNATLAAKLAGYRGNENTLANVGAENLRKPEIQNVIGEHIASMRERLRASELLAKTRGMFLVVENETDDGSERQGDIDQKRRWLQALFRDAEASKAMDFVNERVEQLLAQEFQ